MNRTVNNNPSGVAYCCEPNCNKDATKEIVYSNQFEDYTHSCDNHLPDFTKDREVIVIDEIKAVEHCRGCEEVITGGYISTSTHGLCSDCDSLYDNKTGHCSLSCCLGNGCDESC